MQGMIIVDMSRSNVIWTTIEDLSPASYTVIVHSFLRIDIHVHLVFMMKTIRQFYQIMITIHAICSKFESER